MIFLFENFAESRLEGGASQSDSVLYVPVQDAAKFPEPTSPQQRFTLILYDGIQAPEVVWAKANPGTGAIEVERGQEGSAATAWRPGTAVINAPTKVSLNYLASGGADSWHQELVDMVNEAYARIAVLHELVLTENSAMATRIENVEAGWSENNAQVQTLARAFASISEAWAAYQVEVDAQSAEATARATQALNASTNAERAVAELETKVEAAIGEDSAAFAEKIQSLVDFDAAQVTRNTAYETQIEDNRAGLAQEVLVRTTQFDAQASVNQSLDSRIAGNTGRIETEEITRAGETSALAQRSSNLESEVIAGRGGAADLNTRITEVATTAASDTSAVASRTSTLETQMTGAAGSGLRSRIETEEQARVAGDAAQASRSFAIESMARKIPNLLRNSDASQGLRYHDVGGVWTYFYDAAWGSIFGALGGDTSSYLVFDKIRVYGDTAYTVSWLGDGGTQPQHVAMYMQFLREDLSVIADGQHITNFEGVSWTQPKSFSFGTPVDCVYMRVICVKSGADQAPGLNAFFSRVMVNLGWTPVAWSDEATARDTASRITVEETTRATQFEAMASRISTVEAMASGANMLTRTSFPQKWFTDTVDKYPWGYWTPNSEGWVFGAANEFTWHWNDWRLPGETGLVSEDKRPHDPNRRAQWHCWVDNVEAGKTYMVSALSGAHRCEVQVYIDWYDANGNGIAGVDSWDANSRNANEKYGGAVIDNWKQIWYRSKAPPGATRAVAVFRHNSTMNAFGWQDSYMFITRPMFEECAPNALRPGPWNTGTVESRVVTAETAIANAGNLDAWWEVQAIAGSALAGIRARANSAGGSQIGMIADAIALFNNVMGQAEEVLVAQSGNVYIRKKLILGPLGELEFDPTYPAIFWKIGSATLAIGKLPQNGLLFWFGPTQTPADMRKSNATIWFDTTGNSYWGGQIFAGTLSNSGQGTNTTVPTEFILGPFGTNGAPITIVWSYEYNRQGQRWGNQTGNISGSTTALVRLYRQITGQAETLIDTMTVSGNLNATYDGEPVPGQPSGTTGQTFFTEYMGQSKTYTDNAGGTQQRRYRIRVETRTTKGVGGLSNTSDGQTQRYGITSSES